MYETISPDTDHVEDVGISYTRVSSRQQLDGTSLEEQDNRMEELAETQGIHILRSIEDAAESGSNFNREGIRQVRHLAARPDVSFLLVDDIDRIGRHVAETLFYIYELREECGVTILTYGAEELDVTDCKDLVYVMMEAFSSQSTNELKTRRSMAGRARGFKNKNWDSGKHGVPYGYRRDGDGWIEIDPTEMAIVLELFKHFIDADPKRAYTEVEEKTQNFPGTDVTGDLKYLFSDSVYIGNPSTGFTDETEQPDARTFCPDEDLRIVSDETFEKANEKIEEMLEIHGYDTEETTDVNELVETFGPVKVANCRDIIQIRCPLCDAEMVKNGTRELEIHTVHNYICTAEDCGTQRKFPVQSDMDSLTDGS